MYMCTSPYQLHFSQVLYVVKVGALKPLCDLLVVNDAKIVMVILDAISNILDAAQRTKNLEQVCVAIEECEGLDKIEALQQHENTEVYQLALSIIEKYFSDEVRERKVKSIIITRTHTHTLTHRMRIKVLLPNKVLVSSSLLQRSKQVDSLSLEFT